MRKTTKRLSLLILLLCPFVLPAQELLSQREIVLPDSLLPVAGEIASETHVYAITYLSDGLKVNGYMARPAAEGRYPVIIFNRGGNRDFGALNDHSATFILGRFAAWGYVAVATNYRGAGGSEGQEEFGGQELADIMNIFHLTGSLEVADTSRTGVFGFSRGGMMTYQLLRNNCRFKAAVVGAGPTDMEGLIADRPQMEAAVLAELVPDYEENRDEALAARSAILWADELCKQTPLLIIQGSADWRVNPEQSLIMVSELYKHRHPVRFLLLEGADHGISEHKELMWESIRAFFDLYLAEDPPQPNMTPHGR